MQGHGSMLPRHNVQCKYTHLHRYMQVAHIESRHLLTCNIETVCIAFKYQLVLRSIRMLKLCRVGEVHVVHARHALIMQIYLPLSKQSEPHDCFSYQLLRQRGQCPEGWWGVFSAAVDVWEWVAMPTNSTARNTPAKSCWKVCTYSRSVCIAKPYCADYISMRRVDRRECSEVVTQTD